ncbi:uncharacterized protein LOC118186639 [Stegodyphus dumicola]|uniref:uncharacterized protein LOC118186639 n=1 Tax=Stegodyphus dumicola TaxID=202533 RepID=UPI0015B1920C|nr:uncharacterized protein LOC118186639 [Stegodyphus dumicola]
MFCFWRIFFKTSDDYVLIFTNWIRHTFTQHLVWPGKHLAYTGLAWEASLRMFDVQLELLTDPDMYLFIEKGIRGGIAMISHRFSQANNKYMENYDPTKPSSYIMYLDANNLYGWAMSQALPTHDFRWHDDAEEGCILEVDLEYPRELHDDHSDYPLAPEQVVVTPDMWSPYTRDLAAKFQIPPSSSIPNWCQICDLSIGT